MARKIKSGIEIVRKLRAKRECQKEEETLLKWRLIKAVPLMLLGLLIVFFLLRTDKFYKIQTSYLDALMRLDTPAKDSSIVIVDITQEDFETVFEHKSRPLNPNKLHDLITAVSKGKPCIIGVDVDTSFSQFKDLRVKSDWSPVIWTRGEKDFSPDVTVKPKPVDVLGGQKQYNADSGLPNLFEDAGGVTRFYTRAIETEQNGKTIREPTFFWTVFKRAAEEKCAGIEFPDAAEIKKRENETDEFIIRYSRGNATNPDVDSNANGEWTASGRLKIPASRIFRFAESPDWANNSLIRGKIVLIGGTYLGEDLHETPLGRMAGVEINANVIESELRGGIRTPNFWTMLLLGFIDAALLFGLLSYLPTLKLPKWKIVSIGALALLALSLICSFLTFCSFSYWLLFALMMAGVLAAELLDNLKDFLKDSYKRLITDISVARRNRK
ncbi:MAG TPA: CHASE2 domain-containing protein [Pyrinomonadaceae bacterium]|nr:CHASE2 domain-containing protein [Pyrinomonadaceae bacterium]